VISQVELIRKDKEKFRSARKIPPVENGRLNEVKGGTEHLTEAAI
jgi:hypothetical protein